MAYDEELAERVRELLSERPDVTERKMFGGLGWMVSGNMACALMRDGLVVRLAPEDAEDALREPGARSFGRMGAKPMKGFVLVEDDSDLAGWVEAGVNHASSLPPK